MATENQNSTTLENLFEKIRESMKELQSYMDEEFKQVMKKSDDLRASIPKHDRKVLICGYMEEEDCLCEATNSLNSVYQDTNDEDDVDLDFKEEESHQTQLQIQQNVGSIVPEIGGHEDFLAEIEDPSSLVNQVCAKSNQDKVISVSKSDYSSPSLSTNTAIGTICSNKNGFLVADNMLDKSSERNGDSVDLKPKPPDAYNSLNNLIMYGFNATTEPKTKESIYQCLISVVANNQQPSQVVYKDYANWFSPYTVHRFERQVVPHYFSGKFIFDPGGGIKICFFLGYVVNSSFSNLTIDQDPRIQRSLACMLVDRCLMNFYSLVFILAGLSLMGCPRKNLIEMIDAKSSAAFFCAKVNIEMLQWNHIAWKAVKSGYCGKAGIIVFDPGGEVFHDIWFEALNVLSFCSLGCSFRYTGYAQCGTVRKDMVVEYSWWSFEELPRWEFFRTGLWWQETLKKALQLLVIILELHIDNLGCLLVWKFFLNNDVSSFSVVKFLADTNNHCHADFIKGSELDEWTAKKLVNKNSSREISMFWSTIKSIDQVYSALKDMAVVMKQLRRLNAAIEAIKSFKHLCPSESHESLDNILVDLYKTYGRTKEQNEMLQAKLEHNQCNLAICLIHMNKMVEAKFMLQIVRDSCKNSEMDESYAKSYECAIEMLAEFESQPGEKTFASDEESHKEIPNLSSRITSRKPEESSFQNCGQKRGLSVSLGTNKANSECAPPGQRHCFQSSFQNSFSEALFYCFLFSF